MIKTIKKIDLQGNEIWQEVVVCNRCKKVLDSTDFVYRIQWTGWSPVQIKDGSAYGFKAGTNPERHICEDCQKEVESFLEGKDLEKKNKRVLTTFEERVAVLKESLQYESTPALIELLNSCMCSVETADAIDLILKERQL